MNRIGGVHKSPTCCGLFRYRGRGPGCLQGDELLVELGHLDRLLDHRANYRQDAKLSRNLQHLAELVMLGLLLALAVQLDAVSEGMYANQVAELGAIGAPFAQEGQPFGGQHQGAVVEWRSSSKLSLWLVPAPNRNDSPHTRMLGPP